MQMWSKSGSSVRECRCHVQECEICYNGAMLFFVLGSDRQLWAGWLLCFLRKIYGCFLTRWPASFPVSDLVPGSGWKHGELSSPPTSYLTHLPCLPWSSLTLTPADPDMMYVWLQQLLAWHSQEWTCAIFMGCRGTASSAENNMGNAWLGQRVGNLCTGIHPRFPSSDMESSRAANCHNKPWFSPTSLGKNLRLIRIYCNPEIK